MSDSIAEWLFTKVAGKKPALYNSIKLYHTSMFLACSYTPEISINISINLLCNGVAGWQSTGYFTKSELLTKFFKGVSVNFPERAL